MTESRQAVSHGLSDVNIVACDEKSGDLFGSSRVTSSFLEGFCDRKEKGMKLSVACWHACSKYE